MPFREVLNSKLLVAVAFMSWSFRRLTEEVKVMEGGFWTYCLLAASTSGAASGAK
jgi:hypothetical protein